MNAIAILVLAALVLEYALNLIADLLNLRALDPRLPREFEDVYDEERYAASQSYTRARTRFGILTATFELSVLLGFWALGGFGLLDGAVRELGLGNILTGLLFIGALVLGKTLLMLPFRWYSTFVLEERFGFNRTTPRTFAVDLVKGLLLGGVLGGVLLGVVLLFFERSGPQAWLYCWIATMLIVIALQYVAPTWIMPLFNEFEPLDDGELKQKILGYAERVGFPLAGIFVIDGSKRSTKANAFFTGFGKNKRIALFDTLIEKQSTDELLGVVAHEIGHYQRKHILQGMVIGIVHMGVVFWLLSLVLRSSSLFEAFGVDTPSVWAGLVFFGLLFTPVELALSTAMSALSRRNEFQADAYSAETTGRPETLVHALKKLSSDNLSNLTPHPFYVFLHHSHPPVLARIQALS